jgi:hypothetical protein
MRNARVQRLRMAARSGDRADKQHDGDVGYSRVFDKRRPMKSIQKHQTRSKTKEDQSKLESDHCSPVILVAVVG